MSSSTAQISVASPALQSLRLFIGLFHHTEPAERSRVLHLAWLTAIIMVGAGVRFWGLGEVGLHGDEDTMALAVQHILIDGRPILPSGMFYPRGMTQLYLMAGSVAIFGESEWALRLPSVLCGIALIPIAFMVGRRFLLPAWNLGFTAAIALLPQLIIDSQTARMYIFMIAAIAASMACLFAWERTKRLRWLISAAALLILGLDFQILAVAAVLMFFIPGLVSGDMNQLLRGAAAALVVVIAFLLVDAAVDTQYPQSSAEFAARFAGAAERGPSVQAQFTPAVQAGIIAAALLLAALAAHLVRAAQMHTAALPTALLLFIGVFLQATLHYHLAAPAYLSAIVLLIRHGSRRPLPGLAVLALGVGALTATHAALVWSQADGSVVRLVGAMIGAPSVWPYVRVGELSEAAGVLLVALLGWGAWRLAQRRSAPDFWLLAVLGVLAPVFALGLFAWNVPARYTEMALIPLVLCAFAYAQHGANWLFAEQLTEQRARRASAALAGVVALLISNPVSLASVVDGEHQIYPDHKGAAEFLRSQSVVAEDIVLVEDVLQQTYYLGAVDYWVIGGTSAAPFIIDAPAGFVDFYTRTPVISSAAMLEEALRKHAGKRIFVIGSGENQSDGRRTQRGEELHAMLESERFRTVFVGRDGLTRVLRPTITEQPPGRRAPAVRPQ